MCKMEDDHLPCRSCARRCVGFLLTAFRIVFVLLLWRKASAASLVCLSWKDRTRILRGEAAQLVRARLFTLRSTSLARCPCSYDPSRERGR